MDKLNLLLIEISKAVKGKDDIIEQVIITIMAGGHILMEDIPGVGKTTLAVAVSRAMGLDYKRMQFTPDVLPSDVTGFSMYSKKTNEFEYKSGAIMTNIFLADEINRTSSKTQSALLEAMEEGSVTVDGVTRKLPEPFIVMATQNPFGSAGTQRLPQSQIERFMTRLSMGYPDRDSEIEILKNSVGDKLKKVNNVISREELMAIKGLVDRCYADDAVCRYIVDIVDATRNSGLISIGISPRGSVAILKMAKAYAVYKGRDYVIPEDIKAIIYSSACHRIELSNEAAAREYTAQTVIKEILESVRFYKK